MAFPGGRWVDVSHLAFVFFAWSGMGPGLGDQDCSGPFSQRSGLLVVTIRIVAG